GSKERYYAVRRRKARPGPLAQLTRALKYRVTEWPPGPVFDKLSRLALRTPLARQGLSRARLVLVDHHRAHAAGAAWAAGFAPCAVLTIDGVGDGLSSTISSFRDGRLERVVASPAILARRVLRARDQPAQHARARRRRQSDGVGGLCRPNRRRGQPVAVV